MLRYMHGYCLIHFAAEEKIMNDIGYPDLRLQAIMHKEFIGEQHWLHNSLKLGYPGLAKETVDFLQKWIAEHVTVEDKKIGEYMRQMSAQGQRI